ncbi:MAG: type I methionyl aminopeptidase [Candidatus Goldbacteria bacterium]|nr:type I methionyl aminopeptidase [Candidatus Goldiibacteriota bacterium]
MIELKSKEEINKIKKSCEIVRKVLNRLKEMTRPGLSTMDLDEEARKITKKFGAKPAFLNYRGYPGAVCISVNEEVVHGIPSPKRILKDGDIVSIDFGVVYDGFFGDAAETVPVGHVSPVAEKLINVTRESLYKGIEKARPGNKLFDISSAVQEYAEKNGFSVVRDFVGHGVGKKLHEEPMVPNFGRPGTGIKLENGMVLAIEPMINEKGYEVNILDDDWTVITRDGGLSAHFEHTIVITENAPEILTK